MSLLNPKVYREAAKLIGHPHDYYNNGASWDLEPTIYGVCWAIASILELDELDDIHIDKFTEYFKSYNFEAYWYGADNEKNNNNRINALLLMEQIAKDT